MRKSRTGVKPPTQPNFREAIPMDLDLRKTNPLTPWSGGQLWKMGYILREVTEEKAVVPIQVFYDPKDGRILSNTLPPEIRHQYETISEENNEVPELNWEDDQESWDDSNNSKFENNNEEEDDDLGFDNWWEDED